METKTYSGELIKLFPTIHTTGVPTPAKRFYAQVEGKKEKKSIKMAQDLWEDLYVMGDSPLIDSKVHDGTVFMPILIDKKLLVDTDLLVYKITHRAKSERNYLSDKTHKCITKFICPHHYKKNPQVRYADGVLYCNRCGRVLNTKVEEEEAYHDGFTTMKLNSAYPNII